MFCRKVGLVFVETAPGEECAPDDPLTVKRCSIAADRLQHPFGGQGMFWQQPAACILVDGVVFFNAFVNSSLPSAPNARLVCLEKVPNVTGYVGISSGGQCQIRSLLGTSIQTHSECGELCDRDVNCVFMNYMFDDGECYACPTGAGTRPELAASRIWKKLPCEDLHEAECPDTRCKWTGTSCEERAVCLGH